MKKADKIKKETVSPIIRDSIWLKRNARKYWGQWIALNNGKLMGADISRIELHGRLEEKGKLKGSVFMKLADY